MVPRALTAGFATVAAWACVAAGGCGGEDESAVGRALAYLPADSVVTVALDTDLESANARNLDAAFQRFGEAGGLDRFLQGSFEDEGVDFAADVKPQLGEHLVLGLESTDFLRPTVEGAAGDIYTAAMAVNDGEAASELLAEVGDLEQLEPIEGTDVFADAPDNRLTEPGADQAAIAVDGDMLVFAGSVEDIEAALARADAGDGLSEGTFSERLGDLPENAIVRGAADAQQLLESAGADTAASVPWIGSLHSFGFALEFGERDAAFELLAAGSDVEDDQLPIATGAAGPDLLRGDSAFGNVDQAQTLGFLLATAEAMVPSAAFDELTTDRWAGVDLNGLADAFGAGVRSTRTDGRVVARSEVTDPGLVASALEELHEEIPRLQAATQGGGPEADALAIAAVLIPALPVFGDARAEPGSEVEPVPGEPGLYRLVAPDTPGTTGLSPEMVRDLPPADLYFGLVDDVWVVAPTLKLAREAAAREPRISPALPGALAGRAELDQGALTFEGYDDVENQPTLTIVEAAVEAAAGELRLRMTAGL